MTIVQNNEGAVMSSGYYEESLNSQKKGAWKNGFFGWVVHRFFFSRKNEEPRTGFLKFSSFFGILASLIRTYCTLCALR